MSELASSPSNTAVRRTGPTSDSEFVIETSGHVETPIGVDGLDGDPPPQYVQSATLNGEPLHATHLSAADVHRGGRLHLRLGPEPSAWGSGIRPPSLS